MWNNYLNATSISEATDVLARLGSKARVVAGATDLILELERGVRKDIDTLVDITRVPGLDHITLDEEGWIHLGPMVTHNHCVASKLITDHAYPLARACWEVGSPQIRNRGTIAGNLITGSPANDTITPLMALGARVSLQTSAGTRTVPLAEFYLGVRKTVMTPQEMMVDIAFPALKANQRGTFIKYALRQAQAISLVNTAIVLTLDGKVIQKAAITLGAVSPKIIHAEKAEAFLVGKELDDDCIQQTSLLAREDARPINDIRSSAEYRKVMTRVIVQRGLRLLKDGSEREGMPVNPVLLWGSESGPHADLTESCWKQDEDVIETTINGKEYHLTGCAHKTLLRMLREDAGLIGTKEGCAEGECGACTVYLDGIAVMSCMVPAPRAQAAEIVTVEGLAVGEQLHPVQQAFLEEGAVQCGYCTPGFLMSAAKLLEERPTPSQDEIKQAITGNLCRCTGYYKIIQAIELAAEKGER